MIDLHVHTKTSDGSLFIGDIAGLALNKGIRYLAITDHDTTIGLNNALKIGKEYGIEIIPGIEISAYDYKRNRRAHILGLYITPEHQALEALCMPMVKARNAASKIMVEKIIEAGFDLSWAEVQAYAKGGTGVYKQHIMHALMKKGYCESIYCGLYKKLFRRGDELHDQGIAFVPLEYVDVIDAIRAVNDAGGIAILAHPGQMNNFDAVEEWTEAGLQGIEAFHPCHSAGDIERSFDLGAKYHLAITGGSDYHGFYGEAPVELGCSELDEECITELKARARSKIIQRGI